MAGDEDEERISGHGLTDRPGCSSAADPACQILIAAGAPIGDLGQGRPDLELERCPGGRDAEVEVLELAGKVGAKLFDGIGERAVVMRRTAMCLGGRSEVDAFDVLGPR